MLPETLLRFPVSSSETSSSSRLRLPTLQTLKIPMEAMKFASATLNVSCRTSPSCFRNASALQFTLSNPITPLHRLHSDPKGCRLKSSYRRLKFSLKAVAGNTTVFSDESEELKLSSARVSGDEGSCFDVEERDGSEKVEEIDDGKMARVCDKLIDVFMVDKPTPTDWRRLIAFSTEWSNLRLHFFKRCMERTESEEDLTMKHNLLRFVRKLKEVDEDVQRHEELLEVIKNSTLEINEIVAKRRKDFTKEFFVHLHTVAESYYNKPEEQKSLAKLGTTYLAAIQVYDNASESHEALRAAELKLQDIINSPSVDAACKKIDSLAERNQLDSTLVLMITKAWSAAKETDMAKDEAKDVLYHLYKTALGNLQRLMPKEIRIVKYLLTVDDPQEQLSALNDAFTPGIEVEGQDTDSLYTTPEKLHTWITTIVKAYHNSEEGTLLREARDLMNPEVIKKMEYMKMLIEKNFM